MAITGTDKLSMDIIKSLENGTKVKDIPSSIPRPSKTAK